MINVKLLGQVGCRFELGNVVIYVDPYLSDSVERDYGSRFRRLIPAYISPDQIVDANWILITHDHSDHCDLDTLLPMIDASPSSVIIGPPPVIVMLKSAGVDAARMQTCGHGDPIQLSQGIQVSGIPSAHPEVEYGQDGAALALGWLIEWNGLRVYHAGDTALTEEYYKIIKSIGRIDVAFLPVNEMNFYRTRAGVIGNMSIREAYELADELGVKTLIPLHWDMFEANSVCVEELDAVYNRGSYKFRLDIEPERLP